MAPFREGLFASAGYLGRHGAPKTPSELPGHQLIGYRFVTFNPLLPVVLNSGGEDLTVDMPSGIVTIDIEVNVDDLLADHAAPFRHHFEFSKRRVCAGQDAVGYQPRVQFVDATGADDFHLEAHIGGEAGDMAEPVHLFGRGRNADAAAAMPVGWPVIASSLGYSVFP